MCDLTWKPYPDNRVVAEHHSGFYVIKPADECELTPYYCDLCNHVMRTTDDELSHREFGCCNRCAGLWAYPRKEQWKDGWRPSTEQVAEAEKDRLPIAIVVNKLVIE